MTTKTKAKPVPSGWRNRIIKSEERPASDFLANPDNWRIHPLEQQAAMGEVLGEIGWVARVMVNMRTAPEWGDKQNIETLLDGHMRVALALRRGDATPIPADFVDLLPEEEALILATFDPLGQMAAADNEKLIDLLSNLQDGTQGAAIEALLDGMVIDAGSDKLPTQEEKLRPRTMLRILISVPVDSAIDIQSLVEQIAAVSGVEIDYGSN